MLDITASRRSDQHPDGATLSREVFEKPSDGLSPLCMREAVMAHDCGAVLQRIEGALTHLADWPAREGAAPEDVRQWWTHVLTLHRKNRTLNKELKEAERALGEELSEQNFAWLQDVRGQLSAFEGTEATIEGFGALSGRK